MALGRKTGGRVKGRNKLDDGKAFVVHVERALAAGGMTDGLINITCRQLMNPDSCNPILMKLLDYKLGKPKGENEDHKHLHLAMTSDDANQLIREYFGFAAAGAIEVSGSHQIEETQQDNELLPE